MKFKPMSHEEFKRRHPELSDADIHADEEKYIDDEAEIKLIDSLRAEFSKALKNTVREELSVTPDAEEVEKARSLFKEWALALKDNLANNQDSIEELEEEFGFQEGELRSLEAYVSKQAQAFTSFSESEIKILTNHINTNLTNSFVSHWLSSLTDALREHNNYEPIRTDMGSLLLPPDVFNHYREHLKFEIIREGLDENVLPAISNAVVRGLSSFFDKDEAHVNFRGACAYKVKTHDGQTQYYIEKKPLLPS